MSKQNIVFSNTNCFLQGDNINISFSLSTDKTVIDNTTIQYEYCYEYTNLYCDDSINYTENQYAYFYNDSIYSTSWNLLSYAVKTIDQEKIGTATLQLPKINTNDIVVRYKIRAKDDALNDTSAEGFSNWIVCFYNYSPSFSINSSSFMEQTIQHNIKIEQLGIIKPYNVFSGTLNSSAWEKYRQAFFSIFNDSAYNQIEIDFDYQDIPVPPPLVLSSNKKIIFLNQETPNITVQWNPYPTFTIDFDNNLLVNTSYYVYGILSHNNAIVLSNNYSILSSSIINVQIKMNSIKMFMEEDNTKNTGGLMVNKSNYEQPVSLSLYNTTHSSTSIDALNNPSIGFFNDSHELLGKIQYDVLDNQPCFLININNKQIGVSIDNINNTTVTEKNFLKFYTNNKWYTLEEIINNIINKN